MTQTAINFGGPATSEQYESAQQIRLQRLIREYTDDPQVRTTLIAILGADVAWRDAFLADTQFRRVAITLAKTVVAVFREYSDDTGIEELDLSVRAYNVLKREGVHTIGQLCNLAWYDLADMRNMGEKAITDVQTQLAKHGRALKEPRS